MPRSETSAQDDTKLEAFLRDEAYPDASALRIVERSRPAGGASWDTFILDLEVERAGTKTPERIVLRRAPAAGPMPPYDVTKDSAIFSALAESDVPVPRFLASTEDPSVFERPFLALSFVAGDSNDITQVERWPTWQENREALGFEIVDTLAALHRFDWRGTEIESYFFSGKVGANGGGQSIGERVTDFLDRYLVALLERARELDVGLPMWRELGRWLHDNVPDASSNDLVLVHGDYRFGNFIWDDTRLAAVVDWERASLGHRMQDLGFVCMPLSRRKDPSLMGKALPFDVLAERYEQASGRAVDVAQVQYFAVLWQVMEGINATRAGIERPIPVIASAIVAQPNLVARQTLELIEHFEAGRPNL
jgi:aminoglycoside phosphotransferase (APT) family kinase protein